jgi:hypothetical protein
MEDLLQDNLLYLYHHQREMFEQIQQYMSATEEKSCKLIYNQNGTVNLSYALQDGVKLLYAEDERDIQDWLVQYHYLSDVSCDIVMYGLGLTHHLAEMIQMNPNLNFYILEPEIDIFIEMLKVVQIDQLLQHPQIKLLRLGKTEEEIRLFNTLFNTYSEFSKVDIFIPFYSTIDINALRKYYDLNYLFREMEAIEYAFEELFGTMPYRNSIRNLEKMFQSSSLRAIRDKFAGCTALIVGAGPSLELDVEYIKMNRDRLIIFSAGSSIQSLLHFGIKPHFSVSMDPGKSNGRVFEGLAVEDLTLIYVPQIFHGILKRNFNQLFYTFFENDPIVEYLFPDINPALRIRANNSVTGTAIQVAAFIGATKIMFAGQDLSFPNNQYYASGAKHINTENLKNKTKRGNLEVENVNGSFNTTNVSMRSALEDIERLIAALQGVEFVNTSSLGVKIKGANYVPFLQAVEAIEKTYHFDEVNEILSSVKAINEFDNEGLLQSIIDVITTCDTLTAHLNQSLSLVNKIDELSRTKPDKAMTSLAKLEQEFSQVTEHELFKKIIPAWNRGLTKQYDKQVIKIEAEPTIIGKAKLLNEIVVPYIKAIQVSFDEIKQEFERVYEKLQENTIKEKGDSID